MAEAAIVVAFLSWAIGCGSTEVPRAADPTDGHAVADAGAPEIVPSARPPEQATTTATTATTATAPAGPERTPARIEVGAIYALGDAHATPPDLLDSRLGPLVSEPPVDTTHAMPRVIIDVPKSIGPLKKGAVQADARAELWGSVIECYRPGALKDQSLRGETTLKVTIAKGEVKRAKVLKSMPDKDVSACFAKKLQGLEMPSSRGTSTVTMKIHVAPGDEPMPPRNDAATRGPGRLDPERVRKSILERMTVLERCYDEARAYAPKLQGWTSIRIQIARNGTLSEAFEIGTQFPDERLSRCVLRDVRKLVVDPPEGGSLRMFLLLRFDPGER